MCGLGDLGVKERKQNLQMRNGDGCALPLRGEWF